MCADISTVLSDDGECGFGRRNLPLGNSLQNRCFPSLRLELKFHAFNQKGADLFVSSHLRSWFVAARFLSGFGHYLPKNDVMHSAAAHYHICGDRSNGGE